MFHLIKRIYNKIPGGGTKDELFLLIGALAALWFLTAGLPGYSGAAECIYDRC